MKFNKTQIFCFHRVSNEFSLAYPPIPIKVFEKIISFIYKNYFVIPIEEIGNNFNTKKPYLIITFDDAYYDFYENVLPIFIKYKLPALQHVISNCAETGESFWTQKLNNIIEAYYSKKQKLIIPELNVKKNNLNSHDVENIAFKLYLYLMNNDKREEYIHNLELKLNSNVIHTRMMNWNELNECTKYGISIGSHTHNHPILPSLEENKIKYELEFSRQLICKNIPSSKCLSLAFPNGKYNKIVIQLAYNLGYKYLFSTESNSIYSINRNFVLPRFSIYNKEWWKNNIKLLYIKYLE